MTLETFVPLIDFILKGILYNTVFKVRRLDTPYITSALCAGASLLAGYIPLPEFLHLMITIGIAGYFIVKNSDAEVFPDGVGIPIVVEVVGAFVLQYALLPLIQMLW